MEAIRSSLSPVSHPRKYFNQPDINTVQLNRSALNNHKKLSANRELEMYSRNADTTSKEWRTWAWELSANDLISATKLPRSAKKSNTFQLKTKLFFEENPSPLSSLII